MIPVRSKGSEEDSITSNYYIVNLLAFQCIKEGRKLNILIIIQVTIKEIPSSHKGGSS